jgi:hypothetical protein
MSIHHPPHVVNESYVRSIGLRDPSRLYTLMAPNVWVIERRLSAMEMLLLEDFEVTRSRLVIPSRPSSGEIRAVKVKDLYKPVWLGGPVWAGKSALDFKGEPTRPDAMPYSFWLRIDLVEPSERIRFPALPASVNYKEGLDMGDLRELYSWDGNSFKLRDGTWGRE